MKNANTVRSMLGGPALILLIGALVPLLLTSGFHLRLVSIICIYTILCTGFNLLYGYAGQISMGQQGFFALGAYGFTLLMATAGWSFSAALPAALVICAVVALLIGIPLLRLRSHYLAMATLCFGLVFAGVASRWIEFTGGTAGMMVPSLKFAGHIVSRTELYYALLLLMVLVLLLQNFIVSTHMGRALMSLRGDETAAQSLGVNVTAWKLRIFVLSAVLAGLAGIASALVSRQVNPSFSEFPILVSILTIAVVGGLGTRYGALLGACVVVIAPQGLTAFGESETVIYGVCLLLFLMFMPHGLSGLFPTLFRRLRRKAVAPAIGAAQAGEAKP
ncbi:branched-chain amino acid ABC transporter permease [Pseudomonas typographi]|uniref:Branched-chain amino acid ABC transporter permease n=1 Tax=Pseudomonas typographi TaxID=2715964 RepID=A0ABR7YY14_9PSED|nr:branched-chain amino acid ABC transporter permease [Pseudomonas typographi]MBD1587903.1 branched-chain amino acid ABC transporter permease [Pseudomonas typographi]MBD1598111.1 branched-chain amino acid ABC transporter permease [Pseudomonas typographi]